MARTIQPGDVDPHPLAGYLGDEKVSAKMIKVVNAAYEALEWIERQTEGLVIDCKDSLRLALYGTLRGEKPFPPMKMFKKKKAAKP